MAKNAYIGVSNIAKKIKSMYFGAQVDINSKNLVGNGSFNTGSTGWTSLYPDISFVINTGGYSGNCTRLSIASEPAYPNNNMVLYYFDNTKLFIEGHIYYVSCLCKTSSAMNVILAINDVDSLSRYWLAYSGSKTIGTSWSLISAIGTAKVMNATTDQPYVGIMLRNIVASGSVYVDEVKVFDLTEMFGAGNEPSQSVCDTYLPYGVLLDKARKIKKGYIGVDNVARCFYSAPTEFTSNPAPTGFSGGLTSGTDSNEWGTWTITADVQNSGYYPKDAFDGDTSTHFTGSSMGTSTGTRSITLKCPDGVYIKPSHIQFVGARLGTVTFSGVTESGSSVTFATKTGSTTSNETMNVYPTTELWFKSFSITTTRYSSSYKQPWFTEFQIVSGEIRKD